MMRYFDMLLKLYDLPETHIPDESLKKKKYPNIPSYGK